MPALNVQIAGDTSKLERSLKRARTQTQTFGQRMSGVLKNLTGGLGVFSLGMAGATAAVGAFVSNQLAAADAIGKTSTNTNISTDTIQRWTHAARLGGVEWDVVEKAVRGAARTIKSASDGLATQSRALDQVGVSLEELRRLSPEEQFIRLGEAVAFTEDETLRLGLAQEIFGRAGTRVLAAFGDQAGAFERNAQLLDENAILTEKQIRASERFNDAMTNITATLKGAAVQGFGALVQPAASFVEWLSGANDTMDNTQTRMETIADIVERRLAANLREANEVLARFQELGIGTNATAEDVANTFEHLSEARKLDNLTVTQQERLAVLIATRYQEQIDAIENLMIVQGRVDGQVVALTRDYSALDGTIRFTVQATDGLTAAEVKGTQIARIRADAARELSAEIVQQRVETYGARDAWFAYNETAESSISVAGREVVASQDLERQLKAQSQSRFIFSQRVAEIAERNRVRLDNEARWEEETAGRIFGVWDARLGNSRSFTNSLITDSNARIRAAGQEANATIKSIEKVIEAERQRAMWLGIDASTLGVTLPALVNISQFQTGLLDAAEALPRQFGSGSGSGSLSAGSDDTDDAAREAEEARRKLGRDLREELAFRFSQLARAGSELRLRTNADRISELIGQLAEGDFLGRFEMVTLGQRLEDSMQRVYERLEREAEANAETDETDTGDDGDVVVSICVDNEDVAAWIKPKTAELPLQRASVGVAAVPNVKAAV